MRDFGGMISILVGLEEEAVEIVGRTKLFQLAESLGGVESLIEHPARMTHASTADAPFAAPRNLIRLSVGIESADDLIEDLELSSCAPRRPPRVSAAVSPIDLHHQGTERVIGAYLVDGRPAVFDCGPASALPALEAACGARRRARRPASPAPLAHPPRPRRRGGDDRPRAPARPGARLRDRRAAPRRPVTARGQRAPALRRRLRRALGRARSRAGGEHPDRRRRGRRARVLRHTGARVAPRLLRARRRHDLRR